MENLQDAIGQMQRFGIPLTDRDLGRIERFTPGKKMTLGKGGKWFAKLYEFTTRGGTRLVTGYFGSYKTSEFEKIDLSGRELSPAEVEAFRAQREQQAAAARAETERAQQRAGERAAARWSNAWRSGVSPYATRKRVSEVGGPWVRFERPIASGEQGDALLVPMCRYTAAGGELVGLQVITPDGSKRFGADTAKRGTAAVIGHHCTGRPIFVGEGWATMASVYLALSRRNRCVVAFDCGNLLAAAQMMHQAHPDAPIVLCADDDRSTAGNPGRQHAAAAHKALGTACAGVVVPAFKRPVDSRGHKLTDFNDLHCAEGIEEVARQLNSTLRVMHEFGGL